MKNWENIAFAAIGVAVGYYAVKHFFVTGGRII
jgi:hypothetical protein